ncbi:MAG: hypothetical protein FWH36_08270 [Lentimicrobiaceae bacterium]|nr:hypothetical protein [Lentimicrobiaceae bacterium]
MSEVEIVDFGTSFPKICLPGKIVENYHAICISLGKVRLLTKERDKKIRLRFAEMESAGFEPYAAFSLVFEKMQDSDFCNGKNERGWRADFDFSVRNDKNWLKIYEGKYDNQPVARKLDVCERNMQNFREVMKYFNKQQENE